MSLLKRLEMNKPEDNSQNISFPVKAADPDTQLHTSLPKKDPYQSLKNTLHQKVISELALDFSTEDNDESNAQRISSLVNRLIEGEHLPRQEKQRIISEIVDEAIGFGPITPLLRNPEISEVMVNGPNQVYIERHGKLEKTDVCFRDDSHILHIIEKIVSPIGRRIDESMPMVDARLPDGSRVNAIIAPLSLSGPTITIRKFSKEPLKIEDLVSYGTLTESMAKLIENCVKAKLNIVVSGGTGSGKTTTLNVLSSFISPEERIITIEDAAELQLNQEHVITLESRPANLEGKGSISIRNLVKNALRMRPDRIIVGEVRSGEALDMLQAMNTGHDGSLTTGHANSPRDMLSRLETMVLMAGMDLPVRAIREQISSAIDLIIQQSRQRDGTRKITHITEISGMEGDIITLQDIFTYQHKGISKSGTVSGEFSYTGIRPQIHNRFEEAGIDVDNLYSQQDLFNSTKRR